MGSWLKRQQPVILEQYSDIPYVILEDGVNICFDNCFGETPNKEEHYIKFTTSRIELHRQSTKFFRLTEFPCVIPFKNVIQLDSVVKDGKIDRKKAEVSTDPKNIAIIKGSYAVTHHDRLNLDNYEKIFVLITDKISMDIENIDFRAEPIRHLQWGRTCVTIADKVCPGTFRGYRWTKQIPDLSVDCFGLDQDGVDMFCGTLGDIGISFSTQWMG